MEEEIKSTNDEDVDNDEIISLKERIVSQLDSQVEKPNCGNPRKRGQRT